MNKITGVLMGLTALVMVTGTCGIAQPCSGSGNPGPSGITLAGCEILNTEEMLELYGQHPNYEYIGWGNVIQTTYPDGSQQLYSPGGGPGVIKNIRIPVTKDGVTTWYISDASPEIRSEHKPLQFYLPDGRLVQLWPEVDEMRQLNNMNEMAKEIESKRYLPFVLRQ